MEERGDKGNDSWDSNAGRRLASLNGTGKHPASGVPQRPPGAPRVSRVDAPPIPRVERPTSKAPSPRRSRRGILILGCAFLLCAVLACGIGFIAFNYINGLNASNNAATAVTSFLSDISGPTPHYQQAYMELGPNITLRTTPDQFVKQAQDSDACFGTITNYSEIAGSSKILPDGGQSYNYTVTRSKLSQPYQLTLTVEPDQEGSNNWHISSYGASLGPTTSTC